MKRCVVFLLCILLVLSAVPGAIFSAGADDGGWIEVSTWDEFIAAFDVWPKYSNQSFKVKLMADLHYDARNTTRDQTSMVEVHIQGSHYTFDFNGHTLSATDTVSDTDLDSKLSDFITVHMHAFRAEKGSSLRLIDSVGGGGVRMYSHRAYDNQLAALRVAGSTDYMDCGVYQYTGQKCSTLIIEGGNYSLTAKTEKFGSGTRSRENYYRGCVIADYVNVEIYDGTFTAKSEGVKTTYDMCARELSAFATCCSSTLNPARVSKNNPVVYGGKFISDGYSLHHFDTSSTPDETRYMETPLIIGGAFFGPISYIGETFTYNSEGNDQFEDISASDIFSGTTHAYYLADNDKMKDASELTLKQLHKCKTVYAVSGKTFNLSVTPSYYYDYTVVAPNQSDTFRVSYTVPESMKGILTVKPFVSHCSVDKATQATGEVTKVYSSYLTVDYANYTGCAMIQAGIEVYFDDIVVTFKDSNRVEVSQDRNHAEIVSQPVDCKVAPGESAGLTVVANHALSYQWQIQISGGWVNITDQLAADLAETGIIMEGYNENIFIVTTDDEEVGSINARCAITSTAYSKTTSNAATITFGDTPVVDRYYGGSFKEGGDAVFTLWGYYFENVTWTASSRLGSFKMYTLEEFAAKKGISYDVSLNKFSNNLYKATVTFKNVPAGIADTYKLGYSVKNSLGTLAYSEDNALPFSLERVKPTISSFIKSVGCYEGDEVSFSFSAENMTDADWSFEKTTDEDFAQVFTLEQMQKEFPESTFTVETKDSTSTLTITNVNTGLNDYSLYAYAIGDNAVSNAGGAGFRIKEKGAVIAVGDVNGDGKVNNLDATAVLKYDAGITELNDTEAAAADANGDAKVNNLDATMILKYDAGIIDSL